MTRFWTHGSSRAEELKCTMPFGANESSLMEELRYAEARQDRKRIRTIRADLDRLRNGIPED